MSRCLLAAGVLLGVLVSASFAAGKLSQNEKIALIRGMMAEIGVARQVFPAGKEGIELSADGHLLNQADVQQEAIETPPAARPGQRVEITGIAFRGKEIRLDINGGLGGKSKWYEHVSIGMGGALSPVATANHPHGSQIVVRFAQGVPAGLTAVRLKGILAPVIDWNLRSAAAAALGTSLPPKLQKAIQGHQVLVGMSPDMVMAAKGRADQKFHERDPKTDEEYDDWVYGHPPGDTTFVRFEGERVIRVIDYKADGTKVIRVAAPAVADTRVATATAKSAASANPDASAATNSTNTAATPQKPTLLHPGEAAGTPASSRSSPTTATPILIPNAPGVPPPSTTPPNNGPPGSGPPCCASIGPR